MPAAKPNTLRKQILGKSEFRLVEQGDRIFGLRDGKLIVEGDGPDAVWSELTGGHSSGPQRYFGYQGARSLFLHHYPNGFHSVGYEKLGERGYKEEAKSILDSRVPLEAALTSGGLGEGVLAAFDATNLCSHFERIRIREVLRSDEADKFIQAAARFTVGGRPEQALRDMERALSLHDVAKWTAVTYLPALWRPDSHMFLKPEATMDFAQRVGHSFARHYAPSLDMRVYRSLLDLANETKMKIADLSPRDNIDIQSFIWVVSGAYEGEAPRP